MLPDNGYKCSQIKQTRLLVAYSQLPKCIIQETL